jgi:hypothetical protein
MRRMVQNSLRRQRECSRSIYKACEGEISLLDLASAPYLCREPGPSSIQALPIQRRYLMGAQSPFLSSMSKDFRIGSS